MYVEQTPVLRVWIWLHQTKQIYVQNTEFSLSDVLVSDL